MQDSIQFNADDITGTYSVVVSVHIRPIASTSRCMRIMWCLACHLWQTMKHVVWQCLGNTLHCFRIHSWNQNNLNLTLYLLLYQTGHCKFHTTRWLNVSSGTADTLVSWLYSHTSNNTHLTFTDNKSCPVCMSTTAFSASHSNLLHFSYRITTVPARLTLGVPWYGVLLVAIPLGVLGVPGIGSRKLSLNHRKSEPMESNTRCRKRKPSGVTVTYSWRNLVRGRYDNMNFPG